jgi:drug/metabolite transporter (DMT)-like permease
MLLMGLFLGALAALSLGFSDFLAARAGRTGRSFAITRTALLTAGVLSPLLLLLGAFRFSVTDSLIAAASGVLMGSGLTIMYEGYRRSRVGIVGPCASVLSAVVPVVYDLTRRVELRPVQYAGMLLGIAALGLTTYAPGGGGKVTVGVLLGLASGACFGVAFVLMARTSEASGLSTIVVQRWAAFLFLCLLLPLSGRPVIERRGPAQNYAIGTGVLAGLGVAALQLGLRNGSTGLVSVAASQFATVTVIMSVVFNKEQIRPLAAVGVGCTALAVALMALG